MNLIRQQPLDNVNMDQITTQLMNSGRDKIPQGVKDLAYNRIKDFLEKDQAYQNFIKIWDQQVTWLVVNVSVWKTYWSFLYSLSFYI